MSARRKSKPRPPAPPPPPAELPTFDTMQQCAARAKIPLRILRQAKRHGCPAFDLGSRVRLGPLLEWLFSQEDTEVMDWGDELKKWQAKRQQQFFEVRAGELVDVDTITRLLLDVHARQRDILRQRLENELPTAMAGVDVASGRVIAKRIADEICAEMQRFYDTWKADHE